MTTDDRDRRLTPIPGVGAATTVQLLAEVKAQEILIEMLRHQLVGHRAHWFGASSETAEQLQLCFALHPLTGWTQSPDPARQRPLSPASPDREHVRTSQGLASDRHAIRPLPNPVPLSLRLGSDRHLLVVSPDPSTSKNFSVNYADIHYSLKNFPTRGNGFPVDSGAATEADKSPFA